MKEISELTIAQDVKYAKDHEWVRVQGEKATIGISDYAQDQLGDIVFVELPAAGTSIEKGAEFGTVESVKAVSELYAPVSGTVTSVNTALEDAPDLVNTSCYTQGWMIEMQLSEPAQIDTLMDHKAYLDMLKGA
jgi:glycine cleavage system H protein